jgi:putative hemolysin
MKKIILLIVVLLVIGLGYKLYVPALIKENMEEDKKVGIANPASVNCKEKGGDLLIQKKDYGGEYGLCFFDDNRACEEWAMFRGDCPVGGVKTTGYDTIDQQFCAWSGGQTSAVANSECVFKNGKVCSTLEFYNGNCMD